MRFIEARELLAEATAAGIALQVADGELRYATRNGALSSRMRARLRLLKKDLIAELSRPQFRRGHPTADVVQLPQHTVGWWRELCINQLLANATHVVWRCRGDQCASRFQAALDAAIARHGLLRGRLVWSDGALHLHCDGAPAIVTLAVEDHKDPMRTIESVVWARFHAEEVFRPFLLSISPTEIICGFVLHHFVSDFQSCRILAQELYDRLHDATNPITWPGEQPLQYSDYIRAMTEWLAGAPTRYRLDYWRERMRGARAVCLPGSLEAGSVSTGPLRTVNFRISPDLRARLAGLARSLEASLLLVLLATKFAALSWTLRRSDLVVTTLVSGRDDIALLKLVGNTVDCVPIRLTVSPDSSFATLVDELRACYGLACRYRVQWGAILDAIESVGASRTAPTFNFVSTAGFESARINPPPGSNLSLEPLALELPQELGSAAWHASHQMNLFDNGQYIECHVKYMSLKYQGTTIRAFVEGFMSCLERISRDPRNLIGNLVSSP